jgi:hypothetical protein
MIIIITLSYIPLQPIVQIANFNLGITWQHLAWGQSKPATWWQSFITQSYILVRTLTVGSEDKIWKEQSDARLITPVKSVDPDSLQYWLPY